MHHHPRLCWLMTCWHKSFRHKRLRSYSVAQALPFNTCSGGMPLILVHLHTTSSGSGKLLSIFHPSSLTSSTGSGGLIYTFLLWVMPTCDWQYAGVGGRLQLFDQEGDVSDEYDTGRCLLADAPLMLFGWDTLPLHNIVWFASLAKLSGSDHPTSRHVGGPRQPWTLSREH